MKKQNRQSSKLDLNIETLQKLTTRLTEQQLGQIHGGMAPPTNTCRGCLSEDGC